MDDFVGGWSMQYAAEPCLPSRPSDDGLLISAFLGGGFDLSSDHGGLDLPPPPYPIQNFVPCHDGASLSAAAPGDFMGLDDTAPGLLPGIAATAAEEILLDPFVYVANAVAVAEEPSPQAAFSGYSSTTGCNGNNISSGESNTCGGGYDTDVASPLAAVSRRPALLQTTTTGAPPSKRKLPGKMRAAATSSSSTSITFQGQGQRHTGCEPDAEAIAQVKEMIYRAAAMRPVHQLVCGGGGGPKPASRRRNVRISSDPQTVAARLRRERVSERLRVLQRLVPGGSRLDTASMLDEAASYLKFLKSQLKVMAERTASSPSNGGGYQNGSSLLQSYTGGSLGSGGTSSGSTVLAFGRESAIGGYVKSNRNMQL